MDTGFMNQGKTRAWDSQSMRGDTADLPSSILDAADWLFAALRRNRLVV